MAECSEDFPDTQDEFDYLLFSIRRSIRYHRARMRYYDTVSKLFTITSVISGTAVFASVLAKASQEITLITSAIVALSQACELVLSPSKEARLHSDLARRFISLEQQALLLEFDLNDRKVADLTNGRLDIEMDEPPTLKWLSLKIHNELEKSEHGDHAPPPYRINPLQKLLIQFGDFFDVANAKRYKSGPFQ